MFLKKIKGLIEEKNFDISNIDAILISEKPKIKSFIPQMIEQISKALSIKKSLISVKATTTEGLGFSGQGKGMAAQAVVSLVDRSR